MWRHAALQHGCFYSNGNQYSFMQASFYIIVHNSFSMNFSIRGSSARGSHARMVCVTALDIQVSLRNPMAMLEESMTSVKTLYSYGMAGIDEIKSLRTADFKIIALFISSAFSKLDSLGLRPVACRVCYWHRTKVIPCECAEAIFHVVMATVKCMLKLLCLKVKDKYK